MHVERCFFVYPCQLTLDVFMMYPIFIITIFICAVFFCRLWIYYRDWTTNRNRGFMYIRCRHQGQQVLEVKSDWLSSTPWCCGCVRNPGSTSCSFSSVCFYALVRTEHSITSVLVQQIIFTTHKHHEHHDTNDTLSILLYIYRIILVYLVYIYIANSFRHTSFFGAILSENLPGYKALLPFWREKRWRWNPWRDWSSHLALKNWWKFGQIFQRVALLPNKWGIEKNKNSRDKTWPLWVKEIFLFETRDQNWLLASPRTSRETIYSTLTHVHSQNIWESTSYPPTNSIGLEGRSFPEINPSRVRPTQGSSRRAATSFRGPWWHSWSRAETL